MVIEKDRSSPKRGVTNPLKGASGAQNSNGSKKKCVPLKIEMSVRISSRCAAAFKEERLRLTDYSERTDFIVLPSSVRLKGFATAALKPYSAKEAMTGSLE